MREAIEHLRRGELILLPTETVYGVVADPRIPDAENRLCRAKGRPEEKKIALLAADAAQVTAFGAEMSPVAVALAKRFWPGPLTLVLKTGATFTGFRIPDHPVALALLREAGTVLAATSANRSGTPDAVTAEAALAALAGHVAVALDAGPSPGGVPSTVVKVVGMRVELLRAGALPRKELEDVVVAAGGYLTG